MCERENHILYNINNGERFVNIKKYINKTPSCVCEREKEEKGGGDYRLPRRAWSLMMRSSSSWSKFPRLISGLK